MQAKTGSISFGCCFVAGNSRVPSPAAGITTFRIMLSPTVRAIPDFFAICLMHAYFHQASQQLFGFF